MLVGFFTKFCRPGITQRLHRMADVEKYILKRISRYNAEDVLCAFDIDMTLIQPDHPAYYIPNVRKYKNVYCDIVRQHPNLDTSVALTCTFWEAQRVVDDGIYSLLSHLKDVPKIAFTATPTGPFKDAKRLEVLRYQQLLEKQLHFECKLAEDDFVLEECPAYRGNKPAFYKGVLCSNSENGTTTKGSVLCAFLRKLNWTPKLVVLVDDRSKNLSDTSASLRKEFPKTKFIGIEFLGAHDYCPQKITREAFRKYWSNCFSEAEMYERKLY